MSSSSPVTNGCSVRWLSLGIGAEQYKLNIRVYGKIRYDVVTRASEGRRMPHELGLLAEALADDEDTSKAVMAKAQVCTAAHGFSRSQMYLGQSRHSVFTIRYAGWADL